MTTGTASERETGLTALWNQIYDLKFSKHVPLTVVLLSGFYAIYRSTHYLSGAFALPWYVALPTAFFIELLVLSAGALVFISHRDAFICELENKDRDLAKWSVIMSTTLLGFAFAALLGMAGADAWLATQQVIPTALMTVIQIAQSGMIVVFVLTALLDERDDLRLRYRSDAMRRCPYCNNEVSPNNRARHMNSCPLRPVAP